MAATAESTSSTADRGWPVGDVADHRLRVGDQHSLAPPAFLLRTDCMHSESIVYEVDGISMVGHLAFDDTWTGRRPAVLLAHEGPGLDDHVRGRAERLARVGYCAFALDY